MSAPPTARIAWIARCVWRLKRQYQAHVPLPTGDRGLTWPEYVRLVACVMAEYQEE